MIVIAGVSVREDPVGRTVHGPDRAGHGTHAGHRPRFGTRRWTAPGPLRCRWPHARPQGLRALCGRICGPLSVCRRQRFKQSQKPGAYGIPDRHRRRGSAHAFPLRSHRRPRGARDLPLGSRSGPVRCRSSAHRVSRPSSTASIRPTARTLSTARPITAIRSRP